MTSRGNENFKSICKITDYEDETCIDIEVLL